MTNGTVPSMGFSPEEENSLRATFSAAFEELKGSMQPSATSGRECNNHFDDKFHQELLDGLYSKERLT